MDITRLRQMAEQIVRNFAVQGEAEAIKATAEHIRLYWDPRMKAQLLADDPQALSPVVAEVLKHL